MGILGYPNMDDNNQDGTFGDYSDVYSNFSENETNEASLNAEDGVTSGSYRVESTVQEEQYNNAAPEQIPGQGGIKYERSDNGRLFIYIVVLGLLLLSAAGMFLYKKQMAAKDTALVSDQAMGDYFYDKTAETAKEQGNAQPASAQADMATVEVDLNEASAPASVQKEENNLAQATEAKQEKEMNAIEKAMAKKKADEQKEKKISLGNNSVVIPVSSGGRADPFLPFGQAVVSSAPKFDIVAPPLEIPEADPAVDKILDFKLSGILFDAVRPSAILNIDGAEQLVHKGDVVMGYQVINITRKSVVVKYGANTYEISAGQSLEQGVNLNNNSALSKQFGGAYSADSKGAIKFD